MKKGVIRTSAEQKSALVGNLAAGEVFESLEEQVNAAGQRRVRMERGWVSMTSASGKPLCMSEAAVQQFLSDVPLLQGLDEAARGKLADVLEAVQVDDGKRIVTQGEQGDCMYFIEQGSARAEKDGQAVWQEYTEGEWFGELALVNNEPRSASVTAIGTLRCLQLDRDAFQLIIGDEAEVQSALAARTAAYTEALAQMAKPAAETEPEAALQGDLQLHMDYIKPATTATGI